MNDQYDINKLINEAKGEGLPNGMVGDVPLLGQQAPVMHGLPVNGKLLTIHDLVKLSDGQFRELFLAAIISLAGGVYSPPPPVPDPVVKEPVGEDPED